MAKVQWYPGHMHKAVCTMRASLTKVDVVIELLDARLPYSSANPMLTELRRSKPLVRVLNRSDLADPNCTDHWIKWYQENYEGTSLALSARNPSEVNQLVGLCTARLQTRVEPVVVMVVGIPNVGKSTLINTLARRSVAKSGNEPAMTRQQQWVNIRDRVALLDTPGILWPNVENAMSGYRLAATGAIRETAFSHGEVAIFLAEFLVERYLNLLCQRYGFNGVGLKGDGILDALGRYCGCLGSGGVVDHDQAARILLNDFRSGRLGKITLETPHVIDEELRMMASEKAEKALRKSTRKPRAGNPKK